MQFFFICCAGSIFHVSPKAGKTLSLTEALFPGQSSSLPQNRLLNMTYDCTTKQLDVHVQISTGVEVIPQILSLSNLILSFRVTISSPPAFNAVVLSANTQLFSLATFVAVKYDFATQKVSIKGVPTTTSSLNMQNALRAVSGTSLKVPSGMSAISQITFLGQEENGVTTIAIKGKSNENTVVVILQKSSSKSTAALIADIRNFNLAGFVNTALSIDISSVPLFGTLTIPKLGFSAATGEITSSLLPQLYVTGSPLEAYGTTLPSGVTAHFTVDVAGVSVSAAFSLSKLSFKVPKTGSLSVKKLLDQIPNLDSLNSLPSAVSDILNSQISGFNFDPQSKQLTLGLSLSELTLIPNVLKLADVDFMLDAMIGSNPLIKNLKFSGTWKIGTVSVTTNIKYNGAQKLFHVMATPANGSSPLSIDALLKNVAGVSGSIPSALTSLSLSSVVGNIYNNGKFFIAMSGTVSGGKLYLLFYKGDSGVKVGIAASLQSFRFSDLVSSATGADITSVPYFGSLVVPAMAISITSGVIKSPTLPHLFGSGSPLLAYGDTLPAGVTSEFNLDIASAKGAVARFSNGVIAFKVPPSVDLSVQTLASQIPGISNAMQALPSQLSSILSAKVGSFGFNSTSKDLSIMASLDHFTLVSGFLFISNVKIAYDGTLGTKLMTRNLDFTGTWQIGDYAILTSVAYDGVSKELTIISQSEGGKDLSIENVVQSLAGATVPLPSAISSFTFTGISGKTAGGTTVVVLNGKVGSGMISAVFQKSSSGSAGAVVVDIGNFKLSELIQSATGTDISSIPFFGSLVIPELRFAAATNDITSPILAQLAGSGTALDKFKSGILKGVSGRFVIQIGAVSQIAVDFVQKKLNFKIPDTSSLSLNAVLSEMPQVKDIISSLPSQLSSVFDAKIASFSYDPDSNELQFSGSLDNQVEIVPQFVSLSNVKISLVLVLGPQKQLKSLDFSGDWALKNLPISTTVSYNRAEQRLDITGELDKANGGININDLIMSLSGESLTIPSVLSSVKLSKLSGNKIGDVTLVTLSGSVGEGRIFLIYQKSPSGSAVAFAADTPKFRFSSLVSSATGVDISSIPFFGTLVIPQIGFTISSMYITNPLLSAIYPPTSPLIKFGNSISKGVTASFTVSLSDVKGIVADFAKGELDLQVPKSVDLSLSKILQLIPGVQDVMNTLPQTLQDIASTRLHNLYFKPSTKVLELSGSLDSLAIVPDFLTLRNISFDFSGVIGKGAQVNFVKFKGDWVINTLALTTEVMYEKNLLILDGYPAEDKSLNIKDFIKGLTGTELSIPSALNALKFTRVIGKIQDGTLSIVLIGVIGTTAKVSIAYERSKSSKVVAFAADIQSFQLADLVKAGTGLDISDVPFFGTLTIPALSFVISSKQFSTANLPDLKVPGIPKELLLESIPQGVKGKFLADIGSAVGLNVDFSNNVLTIEVPSSASLSLQGLLSVIPQIKSSIDSLPSTVKDILNAKITKLVFNPATKDLFVSLYLQTLTLVPNIISMKEIMISLDVSLTSSQLVQQLQAASLQSVQPYGYSYSDTPGLSSLAERVETQAVTVNSLDMKGTWVIRDIQIQTNVMYDKQLDLLNIEGVANGGQGLSITDLIKAFSGADLTIPSAISSLKLTKVVAVSSKDVTTVIITATAGKASVYILFQKTLTGSATAIAADIQEFSLVELIKTATGVDLTGAPFISSFVISVMAFSASTNTLSTPLLATTFDSGSPLQVYGDTLPKGVTAFFKVQIGGKTGIEVAYQDKMIKFVIPTQVSLSLSGLLSEIPSIGSVVKALPSPISDLLASDLEAMQFDPTTKTLSVAAKLAQITIIPNIMQVNNLQVSLVTILSSKNGGLQSLDFSADWILGSANIEIKVSYDRASKLVLFAAVPKQGLNIKELISSLTGTDLPIPSVINSVKLIKIVGQKTADTFTLIFSGTIAGKAGVHLIYQSPSNIAIAAGINSFKFSELIQSAVKIDISGVPFFGTFSVPSVGLAVSKGVITTSLLTDVLSANSPLIKYGNTVPNGFTAKFDTPIGSVKGILGSYMDKVISFTVPSDVDASLGTLLSVIPGVDMSSVDIVPVFGDILKIRLKSFAFDVPSKVISIEMFLTKITFYENLLSIRNIQLKLIAKLTAPRSVSAEASGIIALGNTDFAIDLSRDPATTKYALTVTTEKLPISNIITAIGATFLPDDLQTILEQVFNFDILNAKVVYPFGAQPQQLIVSGTPVLFGQKTVEMTAVAFRYSGKIRLIQKFKFGSFNIADLIQKLVGVSLHSLKILDQNVKIEFLLSPSTIKGVSFSNIPDFEGYSLDQGISIQAPLDWPSGCDSDAFCKVAKALLGGVKLSLQGTIANARSFTVTASIGNLNLGGGVVLLNAGLQFEAGVNPTVGVVGGLELKDPAISLNAAIRATVSGVKLEGSMSGCWYEALGNPYLTICNLFLAMTIAPSPLPISGLEFGGRIEVGKKSCGKVITAEGYVGINYINPNENYFYAKVGPVTFQKFFDSFCINVQLPRPLGDSGFPNGFKTSFSLLGKELPHARISIPPGYVFRGTINILGLVAYADIYLQLPTRITAKINLPPVTIANVFKMYRSSTDKSNGPFLNADITTKKTPTIEASGFVEVFGISIEARLSISTSKYEVEIIGKFLNLFEARLFISASYSKSITSGSFIVEGWFKNDLFDRIANAVRDGLKKSADEADRHINSAQNKINAEKAKFDSVNAKLQSVKRDLDSANRAFDSAVASVDNARRKVDGICSYRSCGSGKNN